MTKFFYLLKQNKVKNSKNDSKTLGSYYFKLS